MIVHENDDGTIEVIDEEEHEKEYVRVDRAVFDIMLHEMNCWRRLQHELDGD